MNPAVPEHSETEIFNPTLYIHALERTNKMLSRMVSSDAQSIAGLTLALKQTQQALEQSQLMLDKALGVAGLSRLARG